MNGIESQFSPAGGSLFYVFTFR